MQMVEGLPAIHERVSIHGIALLGPEFEPGLRTLTRAGIPSFGYMSDGLPASFNPDTAISHIVAPPMFTLDDPSRWPGEQQRLCAVIDQAAAVGAECVYSVTGPAGSLSWERAARAFTEAVQPALRHARELGVPLLVEPTNQLRQDINIVYTLRDLVVLAEMSGVGICADLFWCWREPGVDELIARTAAITGLVQISDYVPGMVSMPDRAVPGDGIAPLDRLLAEYQRHGYAGRFDIELLGPRIVSEGPVAACLRAAVRVSELLRMCT